MLIILFCSFLHNLESHALHVGILCNHGYCVSPRSSSSRNSMGQSERRQGSKMARTREGPWSVTRFTLIIVEYDKSLLLPGPVDHQILALL